MSKLSFLSWFCRVGGTTRNYIVKYIGITFKFKININATWNLKVKYFASRVNISLLFAI